MISITSPSAFCLLMSIRTISVAMSSLESVYAMVAPTLPAPITVILLFIVPDHFPSCAVPDGEHNVPPRAGSSELHENKGAKRSFPLSPLTGYILSLINSIISISFYQAFSRFFYMKISEFTAFQKVKQKPRGPLLSLIHLSQIRISCFVLCAKKAHPNHLRVRF